MLRFDEVIIKKFDNIDIEQRKQIITWMQSVYDSLPNRVDDATTLYDYYTTGKMFGDPNN